MIQKSSNHFLFRIKKIKMYFCIENTKGLKYILVLKEKQIEISI